MDNGYGHKVRDVRLTFQEAMAHEFKADRAGTPWAARWVGAYHSQLTARTRYRVRDLRPGRLGGAVDAAALFAALYATCRKSEIDMAVRTDGAEARGARRGTEGRRGTRPSAGARGNRGRQQHRAPAGAGGAGVLCGAPPGRPSPSSSVKGARTNAVTNFLEIRRLSW